MMRVEEVEGFTFFILSLALIQKMVFSFCRSHVGICGHVWDKSWHLEIVARIECPGKSNLSSVCLLICRVFGLAGKHDRPTDLDMLTFEQI